MSCLGVTGKPMVVTVKCGAESDFESEMEEYCITHQHTWVGVGILRMDFPAKMDVTWTTYYGKDFTRIVLELIGALEQRIRLV